MAELLLDVMDYKYRDGYCGGAAEDHNKYISIGLDKDELFIMAISFQRL